MEIGCVNEINNLKFTFRCNPFPLGEPTNSTKISRDYNEISMLEEPLRGVTRKMALMRANGVSGLPRRRFQPVYSYPRITSYGQTGLSAIGIRCISLWFSLRLNACSELETCTVYNRLRNPIFRFRRVSNAPRIV
ncbi:hypothetical protein EVAR_6173_1 [Eumeta japonica]|uniref:Uncharacterized protein n=1 Tax=Eumeta variegata TaxID=151549 RepID=A0A4C1TEH0_EUMVA|nr:hypothetical protein EVAR_6173_1 [Eumeta japonica]